VGSMKKILKVFNGSLRKTLAFSLAEMMVVMLILSLVLAASMPILTRRRHVSTTTSSVPVGSIMSYAGATAPTGWLLCSGQAVSRATYADLYSAISTTYGIGNGSTTFNLPDLGNRFVVGVGSSYARNYKGGADSVTLTEAQTGVAAHAHSITDKTHQHTDGGSWNPNPWGRNIARYGYGAQWVANAAVSYTSAVGNEIYTSPVATGITTTNNNTAQNATSSHENRPPYIALNYIIKY